VVYFFRIVTQNKSVCKVFVIFRYGRQIFNNYRRISDCLFRGYPRKTSPPLSNFVHFEDNPTTPVLGRPDRIARKCPKRKIFCDPDGRTWTGRAVYLKRKIFCVLVPKRKILCVYGRPVYSRHPPPAPRPRRGRPCWFTSPGS